MSALKLDPALCRKLAEALSSGGGLMIDRKTFAAQLIAAADLAERHDLIVGDYADSLRDVARERDEARERAHKAEAHLVERTLTEERVREVMSYWLDGARIGYEIPQPVIDDIAARAAKELAGAVIE